MKKKIKDFLRRFPLTRKVFTRWEKQRIEDGIERDRKILHQNGNKLIHDIQLCIKDMNEIVFFDFGTLLGIIREGKIIGHDLDVDVGVSIRESDTIMNTRDIFKRAGYSIFSTSILDDDVIVQDTFIDSNGIHFDVSYYYIEEGKGIVYLLYRDPQKKYNADNWDVVMASSDVVKSTILYDFYDFKVNVPENYLDHLSNRYGENWRVPDKGYIYWKGPSTCMIEKKGKMIHYRNK